jgi:putative sugar O-methyltransferase
MNSILRSLLVLLSFPYSNQKNLNKGKDSEIYKVILNRLYKIKITNKNIKTIHLEFNKKIKNIIIKKKLMNFLRIGFLQKIFFVHNRLFILFELLELKKKNWNFYKPLLKESHVGDPVRYFLYPNSSGNTINHVYHLSVFQDCFGNKLKNINSIFEFGGGYGCMARIFYYLNKKIKYTIFDTPIINLLQYYYLKSLNLNVGYKNSQFKLLNKHKDLELIKNKKNSLFIANWSLSEVPLAFRKKFIPIIKYHQFFLISFQSSFEKIDNYKYFQEISKLLSKKFKIKIIKNKFYKGHIFKKEHHFFMIGKKK